MSCKRRTKIEKAAVKGCQKATCYEWRQASTDHASVMQELPVCKWYLAASKRYRPCPSNKNHDFAGLAWIMLAHAGSIGSKGSRCCFSSDAFCKPSQSSSFVELGKDLSSHDPPLASRPLLAPIVLSSSLVIPSIPSID